MQTKQAMTLTIILHFFQGKKYFLNIKKFPKLISTLDRIFFYSSKKTKLQTFLLLFTLYFSEDIPVTPEIQSV
jgi:hypothetical protein